MVALSCQFWLTHTHTIKSIELSKSGILSPAQCSNLPRTISRKEVVINGVTKDIGRAAVIAVAKARGMEIAGAVDSHLVGEDIGKVCNMEKPLEVPIINDLTMVLGSISQDCGHPRATLQCKVHHSQFLKKGDILRLFFFFLPLFFQSKASGVVVDFTEPSTVYDNVKEATAFGLRSVVHVPWIKLDTVTAVSAFCDKASMGCLVAPTLSIGSVLLQQAAITASFHYKNVEVVESRASASDLPSADAIQIAENLSNLGQIYNREDLSTDVLARGQVVGEDGVRVHSLVLPGLPSSTSVYFSGPGEVYSLKHDMTDVQCLMPGLILAIRKVVRLKNQGYGLEKFL
ncbi:Dihydrodipicolinate reductase, C-terminal [Dillenia turbinata]|uniref:Dihydrodipicolinate reductase, C-terminal n=1 Tax=Dillenia turbinata TaxID=194707 RepID=A0AAN8V0F3_9MAGN